MLLESINISQAIQRASVGKWKALIENKEEKNIRKRIHILCYLFTGEF